MGTLRPLGLLVAIVVASGCLAAQPPEPSPPAASAAPTGRATPARSSLPVVVVAAPTPIPTASPVPIDERCEPLAFDDTALLGPEFGEDIFLRDESRTITARFLRGLGALYAGGQNVDRCQLFTDRGLATALLFDPHLAAADRRLRFIDSDLVLRVAFEAGGYDLRIKPPRVPINAIFDLPAGSRTKDPGSGIVGATTDVERIGLHLEFAHDGHVWRVDEVGPVTLDDAHWAQLPAPLPPGDPCSNFRRDPRGARYDDRPGRAWCTDHGRGTLLRPDQEYGLITRYPCDGKASILRIARPLGAPLDRLVRWEYVRDPDGAFRRQGWLAARYNGDSRLPADARDTGWTNGNVDLWISPSDLDRGIYLVRGDIVERWARAVESWGVIDCN